MSSITPTEVSHRSPRRRWPLVVIGASAGTATWTGWVGLGHLTGFGVIHPLPGIADAVAINTAVTLPIGVEAYAVYALSIATSVQAIDVRARRFAWRSSVGALGLGMAGQVAYHLMAAAGVVAAPWWIVALVSCIPVAVLGTASYLWHLTSIESIGSSDFYEEGEDPEKIRAVFAATADRVESIGSPGVDRESIGSSEPTGSDRVDRIEEETDRVEAIEAAQAIGSGASVTSIESHRHATSEPTTKRAQVAREDDVTRIEEAISEGHLSQPLKITRVMEHLRIGPTYARAAVEHIEANGARTGTK